MVEIEDVDDADYDLPVIQTEGALLDGQDQQFPKPPVSGPNKVDFKDWHIVYPVYFDQDRSHRQGRRVGRHIAVANPLAHTIVEGCKELGIGCVFEPTKTHPQDWSNPGRARIPQSQVHGPMIKNKRHLLILLADYLARHPTTAQTPFTLKFPGLQAPSEPPPQIPFPRGKKYVEHVPLHSPAMTGGGVSNNLMKDMMNEMQGADQGQASASLAKPKKKKIR